MVSTTLVTLNSSTFFNKMEKYSQPIILFCFLVLPTPASSFKNPKHSYFKSQTNILRGQSKIDVAQNM